MRLIPSLDLELNLRLGRRALRVVTLRQVEAEPAAAAPVPVEPGTGPIVLQVGHDDEHVLLTLESHGGARDGERVIVALGTEEVAELVDRLVAHAAEL